MGRRDGGAASMEREKTNGVALFLSNLTSMDSENRHRHSLRGRFASMWTWSVSWLAFQRNEAAFPAFLAPVAIAASVLDAYSGGGRAGFAPASLTTSSRDVYTMGEDGTSSLGEFEDNRAGTW